MNKTWLKAVYSTHSYAELTIYLNHEILVITFQHRLLCILSCYMCIIYTVVHKKCASFIF